MKLFNKTILLLIAYATLLGVSACSDDSYGDNYQVTDNASIINNTQLVVGIGESKQLSIRFLIHGVEDNNSVWTSSDPSIAVVDANGLVKAVGLGKAEINVTSKTDKSLSKTCTITVLNTNGHDYVNLGLPSGTLWSKYNYGATSQEKIGSLYAWGEVETKRSYTISNYKWCKGSIETLTKYCSDSQYGVVDGRKELLPEDDVVTNWGGLWMTPSIDQFKELLDNCDWSHTELNGVKGYMGTSKINKETIFFPSTGTSSEAGEFGDDYGYYWSRNTHDGPYYYNAQTLSWNKHLSISTDWCSGREQGRPIRPVSSANSATSIFINEGSYGYQTSMLLGSSKVIQVTVHPEGCSQALAWSSSNTSVATINNEGVVTACGIGKTTITVSSKYDHNVWSSITLNVIEGTIVSVSGIDINMAIVKGGSFIMGIPDKYVGRPEQKPQHNVTITKDYYIGETEVTQELWESIMGENPSHFTYDKNLPVENVSWDDCQIFIEKLNQKTGLKFRLPTEAEWNFAAIGGIKSNGYVHSGSNYPKIVAWYSENSNTSTHPVKSLKANELGLYDMSGNVEEWCSDWYGKYNAEDETDPQGPSEGTKRVIRGGYFSSDSFNVYCDFRSSNIPSYQNATIGLRLVLEK